MTKDRAERMAWAVNNNVIGTDLAVDYSHNSGEKAAGWIKQAEGRADGLWIMVEWTPEGASSILNKEFRYFSPEVQSLWVHPKTGAKHKDLLTGGALTNRPFLKGILPVNLSEVLADGTQVASEDIPKPEGGDSGMDKFLEQLRATLKLAEDADEEAILAALVAAITPSEDDGTEQHSEIKTLAEDNPVVRQLVEEVAGLRAEARESKTSMKLSEWHTGASKKAFGLPPANDDLVRKVYANISPDGVEAFEELMTNVIDSGLVPLTESTKPRPTGEDDTQILDKVDKGISKLMSEDDSLSYGDASSLYFAQNPQDYNPYQMASLGTGAEVLD
jgi:hypothetical protein